jgi:hypothetical protein
MRSLALGVHLPYDIGAKESHEGIQVEPVDGIGQCPYQLDVLLRHRPLSIPPGETGRLEPHSPSRVGRLQAIEAGGVVLFPKPAEQSPRIGEEPSRAQAYSRFLFICAHKN